MQDISSHYRNECDMGVSCAKKMVSDVTKKSNQLQTINENVTQRKGSMVPNGCIREINSERSSKGKSSSNEKSLLYGRIP
jgi:hypothetical protein